MQSANMSLGIPVLTFHAVEDARSPLSFPIELFSAGMAALSEAGFHTLTMAELVDCLGRNQPYPEKSFVITFDDGYRSVYKNAMPILRRYGLSATVFLATRGLDGGKERPTRFEGRDRLRRRELLSMIEDGIDIGSHTVDHADLSRMTIEEVRFQVEESRSNLDDLLGVRPRWFAYPYGRFDAPSRAVVEECYEAAFSARLGLAAAGCDLYTLPRVEMHYFRTRRSFRFLLGNSLESYLRLRNGPRRIKEWARAAWVGTGGPDRSRRRGARTG